VKAPTRSEEPQSAATALVIEEQAALRRVATIVAHGVPPIELFRAVSDEVCRLFGTDFAAVGKFDPDGSAIDLTGADRTQERWEVTEFLATAEVFRTGRSARTDRASWEAAEDETADRLRSLGVASMVASPIIVEGRHYPAAPRHAWRISRSSLQRRLRMRPRVMLSRALPASRRHCGEWRRWSRVERNPTRSAWP
jgi:GAF domain-containing protein